MFTINPQNRIKPLLTRSIHIKSSFTYQNYLLKRPKQTLAFKFTRQIPLSEDTRANQAKAELKLQKAFSLLKSAKKVDLSQFRVNNKHLNHNRLRSRLKCLSKISTLLWTRYQLDSQLKTNFIERSFKHLSKLNNLAYEGINQGFSSAFQQRSGHIHQIKDPLNHLRNHPKLKSLQIGSSGHEFGFSQVFSAGLKRYPASLKHLTVTSLLKTNFAFHLKRFTELESLSLKFRDENDSPLQDLGLLSELPKLQSLNLDFQDTSIPAMPSVLLKIAEQKLLKRLNLFFPYSVRIDIEFLRAVQKLHQLTHFTLRIWISDDDCDKILKIVADCLENMKYLEHLKLSIQRRSQFKSFDALQLICEKINNLELLKHLDLLFAPFSKRAPTIPNFLLHLQNLFTKPIPLQTLRLYYLQRDSTLALLNLAKLLQNSSDALQKLKIYFGDCSPDQQSQKFIIEFLKSLSNIRVLELPHLHIEIPHFFAQMVEAISLLKYLRRFHLGKIKDQVPLPEFKTALEAVLTKRGLKRFTCNTSVSLLEKCGFEIDRIGKTNSHQIDLKKVGMKNPFLESINLSASSIRFDLLREFSE